METPPPPQDPVPPQQPAAPQPTPQPQPGAAYAAPMGPTIRFDVIGQAFNMVFADLGTWVVAALIAVVPFILLTIIGNILMVGLILSGGFFLALVLRFVVALVTIAVMYVMIANMYRMAITALNGTKPSVNEMMRFGPDTGNVIVAALIVGICTTIGFFLCVIPGLIVGGLMMFTIPLVVDQRMPAMDAVSRSVDLLKKDAVMATLFFLVISICAGIGAIAFGIGIIFTWPVMPIAIAMLYRDYVGFSTLPADATPAT